MAKVMMKGKGLHSHVQRAVFYEIQNSGVSVELVDQHTMELGNVRIDLMVFDKFFYRANNRVSLSVQIVSEEDDITVIAIGSGGGQGPLFKMDWGAEEDFSRSIVKVLRQLDFEEVH